MAQRRNGKTKAPVEINKFSGGLFTDSSPLTSPEGFSLDEENMVLNIDGSRNRRLGMDLEEGYGEVVTPLIADGNADLIVSTYKWKNAGGNADKALLVIQTGSVIKIFDLDAQPLSAGLIYTYTIGTDGKTSFSYCVVDGILVVASGQKSVRYFKYENGSVTTSTYILTVRDFFGVEDIADGRNIFDSENIQYRPTSLTQAHTYNLRNQSWAVPRVDGIGPPTDVPPPDPSDTIDMFRNDHGSRYPSNSDSANYAIHADPENDNGRTLERFFALDLVKNAVGSSKSASGYFIIDALERGTSRVAADANNRSIYPQLNNPVYSLPLDRTPGGVGVVREFSGRVFHAGFSGEVEGGDSLSPRMSSYILFSQVVNSITDAGKCYQVADPTSKDDPDIVDTDGGFVRINEAYGIVELINLGDSLMVLARNGVWRIVGGDDNGFTATRYIVDKISERGCSNPNSVVVVDNTVMYWGEDGIYHLKTDQFGGWGAENISFGRIQNLYNRISSRSKQVAAGSYDNYERKVRWLYNTMMVSSEEVMELVYDTSLQAFYLNRVKKLGNDLPRPVGLYAANPYLSVATQEPIVIGSDPVVIGSDPVVINIASPITENQKELAYVVITSLSPIRFSFATYRDTSWHDWKSVDGTGVDASGFTVTGYLSGGDFQRGKKVGFLTVYSRKTETGFVEDAEGDYIFVNPSSCIIQTMWEWTNSGNAGRWGRPFQAYRHKRMWFPSASGDDYDDGNSVVVTKNKVRGGGRVLSIKFSTEPNNDLHLYGWSMMISVEDNV